MEKIPNENSESKKYLYHMVPETMEGEVLHPLNQLKNSEDPKLQEIYKKVIAKYEGRDFVPEGKISTLENSTWGDVLQLSPVHPEDLKNALVEAGFTFGEKKFYQIDPEMLDPKFTTIYTYEDETDKEDLKNYAEYDATKIADHAILPQATIDYYKKHKQEFPEDAMPFLFVKVPHILHKGSLDISNLPVITVSGLEKDS